MSRDQRLKWAIAGAGVAGRARAKAIAGDVRSALVAVWRGRYADQLGVPVVPSFEALLDQADAIAICSPTEFHAEQARAALDAGKHVVVEYPVAEDAATTEALFAHARKLGRMLHEEHIELLDAPCSTLVAHIRHETVRTMTVGFERPGPQDATAIQLAIGNIARLHRVAAIGGDFDRVEHVHLEAGKLVTDLVLKTGAAVRATFQQAPYFSRRTTLEVETVASRWTQVDDHLLRDGMPVTLVGLGGLFSRDQRCATARILDGGEPYVSERRILHVMDVVDRLGKLVSGPVPHRSDAGGAG